MEFWKFILNKLEQDIPVILLYVLKSEGSSPGRQGFKMAVAADAELHGTIGGGIMEHKLAEHARSLLKQDSTEVFVRWQYHDKEHETERSGMICSGSQLNAFIPLNVTDKSTLEKIIAQNDKFIQLSPAGLEFVDEAGPAFHFITETEWLYTEAIEGQPVIHIIGGGHVGLALSELMHFLGFNIKLYDDRPDLHTMEANSFAREKFIVDYDRVAEQVSTSAADFIVIATVGYRTDKKVLTQLLGKPFFYLGMLGSDHKVKMLLEELLSEGVAPEQLARVHTPIGINIFSKTTREIAVSIAAEIIREKNKDLPTGRSADL
jgi:xanthine dehydrogenase accessory factor